MSIFAKRYLGDGLSFVFHAEETMTRPWSMDFGMLILAFAVGFLFCWVVAR